MGRFRAAWGVLAGRLVAVPPSSPAPPPSAAAEVNALAVAIALTTEALQPDGGDPEVIRALFGTVPYAQAADVAIGAVILAAHIGQDLAEHEPAEPARLLRHIALVTADRSGVA